MIKVNLGKNDKTEVSNRKFKRSEIELYYLTLYQVTQRVNSFQNETVKT
jgi:hypothetical protein